MGQGLGWVLMGYGLGLKDPFSGTGSYANETSTGTSHPQEKDHEHIASYALGWINIEPENSWVGDEFLVTSPVPSGSHSCGPSEPGCKPQRT